MEKQIDLLAEFEQEFPDEGRASYLKALGAYSDAWRSGDFDKAADHATEMVNISQSDPMLKEFQKQANDYLEAARNARDHPQG